MPTTTTEKFLAAIRPSNGDLAMMSKGQEGGPRNVTFEPGQESQAAAWAARECAEGRDAYFAPAGFDGKRSAANAVAVREFLADIDCGPGKDYPDQTAAQIALADWCGRCGVPMPSSIVNSGNGLHLHWLLDRDISPEPWRRIAEKFKRLHAVTGLKADPTRTADIASLLRVPGTINFKNGTEKPVEIIHFADEAISVEDFEARIDKALASAGVSLPDARPGFLPPAKSEFAAGLEPEYAPADESLIAAGCQQMASIKAQGGAVSEPLWRDALSIVYRCEGAEALIEDYSSGDTRYNPSEALNKAARTGGPAHCTTFEDHNPGGCDDCPHKGKIKSPITLGSVDPESPEDEIPPVIAEFNEKHAVMALPNRVAIATEGLDSDGCVELKFNTAADFNLLYSNKFVTLADAQGNEVHKPAAGYWLKHPKRRTYTGMDFCFDGNAPEDVYNHWHGWHTPPTEGPCDPILGHLRDVVCSGNEAHFAWLLGWFANCVQRPGDPAEVAVVLRGLKGTGKGFVGRLLMALFKGYAIHIAHREHLLGRFNRQLLGKLALFLDEALWAGDKQGENILKALITEPKIVIEPKGIDAFQARNRLKIVMATNSEWAVPTSGDERRFLMIDVSDARKGDRAYFERLFATLDGPELGHFLHLLLRLDLSNFDRRNPPHTRALNDQKLLSGDAIAKWWFDCLDAGTIPGAIALHGGWPDKPVSRPEVFSGFREHARQRGERYLPDDAQVGRRLRGYCPTLQDVRLASVAGARPRAFGFPPLAEAREAFLEALKIDPSGHSWGTEP